MYRILVFSDVDDPIVRNCLGVLGYVFRQEKRRLLESRQVRIDKGIRGNFGRNKYNYSFVPSRFIRALNAKAKIDLIEYLIENRYIHKAALYKTEDERGRERFERLAGERHKADPNIYFIEPKLFNLQIDYLDCPSIERVLENNLHHLNSQSFNHWAYNYRKIGLSIPDNVWSEILHSSYHRKMLISQNATVYRNNFQSEVQLYGNKNFNSYDISRLGFDHKFGGMPVNIFTKSHPILRHYTSLESAVEVGIKHNEGVIIADQLLKKFWTNDFSDFFLDYREVYRRKLREYNKGKRKQSPSPPGEPIFDPDDYYGSIDKYFIDRENRHFEKVTKSERAKTTREEVLKLFSDLEFKDQKKKERDLLNHNAEEYQHERALADLLSSMVSKSEDLTMYEPDEDVHRIMENTINPFVPDEEQFYYRTEIRRALFGYEHSYFFDYHFRSSWRQIIHNIKAGNDYHFERFVDGLQPWIHKNDWRIQIKDTSKNKFLHDQGQYIYKERGEIYYKVISLVYIIRLVEIMKEIWRRLKYFRIEFIPINSKVLVAGKYKETVKKITLEAWSKYLDPRIKIFPEVIQRH